MQPRDGPPDSIGGEHDRTPNMPAPHPGGGGRPLVGAVPDGPLPRWGLVPGARFLPFGPIDEDPRERRGPDDPGLPGAFGTFGGPTGVPTRGPVDPRRGERIGLPQPPPAQRFGSADDEPKPAGCCQQ